jgi:hypothetical protein
MQVFIDSYVFLSFYHFSKDDLEELNKLAVLAKQEEITLHLPDQVKVEVRRNRAGKIAQALKGLRDQRLNLQFPQLCKGYDEYDKLREYQRLYEEQHAGLVIKIEKDSEARNLQADLTLAELFGLGSPISISSEIVERARLRYELGNPPGKRGSLGDPINWECLLEAVPEGQDLNFISDDSDFCSALNRDAFDPFLLDEWIERKHARLVFYRRLSSFFGKEYPDINLADEMAKDALIAQLADSGSFAMTHSLIRKLLRYTDFTHAQINDIVSAAISNNQVYWIAEDPDVNGFLRWLIDGHEGEIDADNLSELHDFLGEADEGVDEIPF